MQNSVNMHGRLARDPVLKETTNGSYICMFSIAVTRNRPDQDGEYRADFFNCKAFGRTAQNIDRFFIKGSEIAITGRLEASTTKDDSGNFKTYYNIIVNEFDFCGSKQKKSGEPEDAAPVVMEQLDGDDSGLPF